MTPDGKPLIDAETPPDWFHQGQLDLWNATERTLIALCGTQGGKTAMLPYWLLRETQRCAPFIIANRLGRKAIVAGPTLTLLQAQAIPAVRQLFVEDLGLGRFVESPKPKLIISPDGAEKLIGHRCTINIICAYTSDPNNLESMTAYAAVWDEGGQTDNKEVSYEAIRRRLKAAQSQGFGRLLITTTPYEWGWLKHRVVDRAATDPDIYLRNWPSWSNPSVSEADCRRELEDGMPDWRWRMMYLGQYERPAGQIYDCFDREFNTCPRFQIPNHWPLVLGGDFGPDNTAAVLGAKEIDDATGEATGRVYIFATYHGGAMGTSEQDTVAGHIAKLRRMAQECVDGPPAQPTGWGGAGSEAGWRVAWTLAGMPLIPPSEKDVEYQIQCIWTAFKRRIEGGRYPGRGQLVIFDDLNSILQDIERYARELDDAGNRTEKIKDKSTYHRLDALRYIGPDVFGHPVKMVGPTIHRRSSISRPQDPEISRLEAAIFRRKH